MMNALGSGQLPAVGWGVLDIEGWDALRLSWSDRGLTTVDWVSTREVAAPRSVVAPRRDVPASIAERLRAYFAGEDVEPAELAVDLCGTPFQKRVWNALRAVPRGKVRSYAGIAADIGSPRATRAVGAANGANPVPIIVPCHRVVGAKMTLGGYSAGLERKRRLLALEGVRVVGDQVRPGQLTLHHSAA